MNAEMIKTRIAALLATEGTSQEVHGLYQATVTVLQSVYGLNSSQEKDLRSQYSQVLKGFVDGAPMAKQQQRAMIKGVLSSMQDEMSAGFVGSLTAGITGEVLIDFVKLSRAALDSSSTDDAKNVGAVLASAAFEDTLRRIATKNSIPHIEKLAYLLTELKNQDLLKGAQVGIAQSYLKFRNSAMHAKWPEIERTSVLSVLAFTEQLILDQFV